MAVSKHHELDDVVCAVPGGQWFFSCITGSRTGKPGIAFFVVFDKSAYKNYNKVFSYIHDTGMEVDVSVVMPSKSNNLREQLLDYLGKTLKVRVIYFSFHILSTFVNIQSPCGM